MYFNVIVNWRFIGLQNENGRLQNKCSQLEAALNAREQEIMLLETKYRKCVEKAKDVIKCYEPRLITGTFYIFRSFLSKSLQIIPILIM